MGQVNALAKEEAVRLHPEEFQPTEILPDTKRLIRTPKGMMAFHLTSMICDGLWKTSHNKDKVCPEMWMVGRWGRL